MFPMTTTKTATAYSLRIAKVGAAKSQRDYFVGNSNLDDARDDARERANWPGIREVQLVEHRTVWSGEGDDFKVERTVTVLDTFRRAR